MLFVLSISEDFFRHICVASSWETLFYGIMKNFTGFDTSPAAKVAILNDGKLFCGKTYSFSAGFPWKGVTQMCA